MTQFRPDRALDTLNNVFWKYCAQGELRLTSCEACGHLTWPIASVCEVCSCTRFNWKRMTGTGHLVSWCSFERDYYHGKLPIPWDTILIELDEGPLFLSNPQGFTWRDIAPGMAVKLAFVPCEDNAGLFHLPVFERA